MSRRYVQQVFIISMFTLWSPISFEIGQASPNSPQIHSLTRQKNNSELNINEMVNKASKLRDSGQYKDATEIWEMILLYSESRLGPSHLDVATSLNNIASLLSDQGQYNRAISQYQRALEIYEKYLGPDHLSVAILVNNLAELFSNQGEYKKAESLYKRALAIRERKLGANHEDVGVSIGNLATLKGHQGYYNAAESLQRKALKVFENIHGPNHTLVATSLNNLAWLLASQAEYKEAKLLFRRSLAIREKILKNDHPDIATSLNNLAWVMNLQGETDQAEKLYRRALTIREKILDKNHPDIASSLNNLGSLLSEKGYYEESEQLYKRALIIREKILGQDNPGVAISLNNLGWLMSIQSRYNEAMKYYQRALNIRVKKLGSNHPDVATSLSNIASLLGEQGQYAKADNLLRKALLIREQNLGINHPETATSLNNLAWLLSSQGQYEEAEKLHLRALNIREKLFGPSHPEVAVSLSNLAWLFNVQDKAHRAEPLYRRVLDVRQQNQGQNHPDVGVSLGNLAWVLKNQGKYDESSRLYNRSLAILEKSFGSSHPEIARILSNIASLKSEQGKHEEAKLLYTRALTIRKSTYGSNDLEIATSYSNLAIAHGNHNQYEMTLPAIQKSLNIQFNWLVRELPLMAHKIRLTQLNQLGNEWEYIYYLANNYQPAIPVALETRLNRHGLLAEIEQRQSMLMNSSKADKRKAEVIQQLTEKLASISLSQEKRIIFLDQLNKLQASLYRDMPVLNIEPVSTASVSKALEYDSTLVEFQRYRQYHGTKQQNQRWGEPQYIALILKPNNIIISVPLGPASVIDATILENLKSIAENQQNSQQILARLSDLVLKPLLPHLEQSRQWFLSPDSELNRVPFAALPAPHNQSIPLSQAVQLRIITTGRELIRLMQQSNAHQSSVVVANPSFDRHEIRAIPTTPSDMPMLSMQPRDRELNNIQWKQLKASEMEGRSVAQLLKTKLISGKDATTVTLKKQIGPLVLHIATHGYFLADQNSSFSETLKAVREQAPPSRGLRQTDSLLRSGLVLAGANQPDVDPNDDGYLTAAEAVNLNLKGTELVVLSACSTGQGEVRTGEGVYGLQRSLTVAGARSTLLSLWKVDDAATAEFMQRFYQRLKAGEGRSDALAAVQQEFRSGKVQSPSGADWKEPYYWAAWQLVGDWRPIKGL